jgi:hypothetical protein
LLPLRALARQSFSDHWASSLLASQDPVAPESVGLDLLRSEPNATEVLGNPDNYLHEAAQDSRNLGRKQGIELIASV